MNQKRNPSRPCPRRARAPPRTRLQPKARRSRNGRALRAGGVAHPLAEMSMPPDAGGPRSTGRRGAHIRSSAEKRLTVRGILPATISFLWCVHTGHGSPTYPRGIGAKRSPRRFFALFILFPMSRAGPAFVSGGTVTWSEVEAARQHDALVAADFGRTKAGLGSCATTEGEAVAASAVASHYNSLPDRHRTLESGSEILRVRNFNNWIKSVLIAKHLPRGRGGYGHAVLDLACGKGGDMLKFKAGNCAMYVGVDIAAQSVSDAVERYNGAHNRPGMPFAATFMVGDFGADSLDPHLPGGLRFALASCQFALHYSFASEARARMLLSNAASRLAAGGTFVATVPDANVLVRRLRASVNLSFGNSLYSVAFDDAHASKRFDPAARVFGIAYRFTLKEAVEDCVEYLVHLPTLERLAAEAGLEMLYARNFTDFFADECAANTELLERMKVLPPDEGGRLTEEEWEVAHTYTCVAFRKKPTATDALAQPVKNAGHRKLDPQEIIVLGAGASGSSAAGSSSAGGGKRARETTEQQWGESDEHGDEKKVKLAVKRESSESG